MQIVVFSALTALGSDAKAEDGHTPVEHLPASVWPRQEAMTSTRSEPLQESPEVRLESGGNRCFSFLLRSRHVRIGDERGNVYIVIYGSWGEIDPKRLDSHLHNATSHAAPPWWCLGSPSVTKVFIVDDAKRDQK